MICERCNRVILPEQRRESHAFPHDGRWVHSACVGELCRQVLALMAAAADDVRLCDPEETSCAGECEGKGIDG